MRTILFPAVTASFLILFANSGFGQPIVADGLTVYYSFDDFVDEVPDGSGNNLNGEVFGNVVKSDVAVRGGGSAFFDSAPDFMDHGIAVNGCDQAAPDACEEIPVELLPSNGYTLAAWVNIEEAIGMDMSIFQPRSLDGSFVNHAQLQGDGATIRFKLRSQLQSDNINSSDKFPFNDAGDPYPIGEWFHYVGKYSADDDLIQFYINGETIFESSADGNAGAVELGDWGQAATIGIVPDSRGRQFYGKMDEFYVFNRALSDDEVGLLFNLVEPGADPQLQAGDADQDLDFDQFDLIQVQQRNKYLTAIVASWGDGDWDAAPGGKQGEPPAGDGLFNQLDIIAALNNGLYLTGPYAAVGPNGVEGDGQTSVVYNPGTGEVAVDAPAGTELTSINIDSAGGIFTGQAAQNLGGSFDNDADGNIFKATFGGSFGSVSFGNVAQTGLAQDFVLNDLTVVGSLAGGGALGDVDLIYVPEPSSVLLLVLGAIGLLRRRRR